MRKRKAYELVTTGQPKSPAFPAQWFTTFCALSPVSMTLLVTVARKSSLADLTPAQGCQDHTPSPSAPATLVARAVTSIASPPHVRDDAYVPLAEAGWAQETMILRNSEEEYFSLMNWTNPNLFGIT
jgi:hypothetical protein